MEDNRKMNAERLEAYSKNLDKGNRQIMFQSDIQDTVIVCVEKAVERDCFSCF